MAGDIAENIVVADGCGGIAALDGLLEAPAVDLAAARLVRSRWNHIVFWRGRVVSFEIQSEKCRNRLVCSVFRKIEEHVESDGTAVVHGGMDADLTADGDAVQSIVFLRKELEAKELRAREDFAILPLLENIQNLRTLEGHPFLRGGDA